MSVKPAHLNLADIRVGMDIDVIDHLRGHGLRGRVTQINANVDGSTTIEFFDSTTGRYAWHASAMGLLAGTGSFWKTYRRSQAFDKQVTFGYLKSYGTKVA